MVIYDLICDAGHSFEGWFKNAGDFDTQLASGMVMCPFCESSMVSKKLAAPKVGRKSNSVASCQQLAIGNGSADTYSQLQDMLSHVHNFIDDNFKDVGNRFAEEALSFHRGEKEEESIRGTATSDELRELSEEGVTAVPLPPKPVNKKKLN